LNTIFYQLSMKYEKQKKPQIEGSVVGETDVPASELF